jgi:adenylate cyclase
MRSVEWNMEIERKFLLETTEWREHANDLSKDIRQIFLMNVPEMIVRVGASIHNVDGESVDRKGYLTIKAPRDGLVRNETEFELDYFQAMEMIVYASTNNYPYIRKARHHVVDKVNTYDAFAAGPQPLVWEVDVFLDEANFTTMIAEVELPDKNYDLIVPSWVGPEVTGNPDYYNANMAR